MGSKVKAVMTYRHCAHARTQYAGDVRRWMWAGLWWAWMGEGQQHVGFSARGQALQILTDDPLRAQRPCERGWLQ